MFIETEPFKKSTKLRRSGIAREHHNHAAPTELEPCYGMASINMSLLAELSADWTKRLKTGKMGLSQ